jgi:hypothetical protein
MRPVTVNDVLVDVARSVVPLYTPYPVTPTLSVEAAQPSETPVRVALVTLTPDGWDGGSVSAGGEVELSSRYSHCFVTPGIGSPNTAFVHETDAENVRGAV